MGRPKRRRLGQNFLVDPGVAGKIVRQLDDEPARVLEIGPGRGALTAPLLERFGRVVALELDPSLVPDLRDRFGGAGLAVHHGDALADDIAPLLGGDRPWQLASNLPYSVGTAILRRLMPRHDLFSRVVVMLQREVADRVVAVPGDRAHGLMALERAAWADAEVAFHVSPHAFRPRPKVTSTVLVLRLHPPAEDRERLDRALGLAAAALTRPRKTLANALRPRADAETVRAAGLDPQRRPGTLDLGEWCRLADVAVA
jgi:16S rRNA (adenine1518-N6/adenine1519-N6)-dimethyltransferase